jgi:DNA-binding winged helix-turn-helix (wHTH) protein
VNDDLKTPENPNAPQRRVRFGPYEADLRTRELWKHGTRLRLSEQPFRILEVLLASPGELVTRDTLQKQLWPDGTFTDFNHSLNAAVKKLRGALSDSADRPKYIETLPRRGYRFIASVDESVLPPRTPPSEPRIPAVVAEPAKPVQLAPVAAHPVETRPRERHSPPRSRTAFAVGLLSLFVGLVAIVIIHWPKPDQQSVSHDTATMQANPAETKVPKHPERANHEPFSKEQAQPQVALHEAALLRAAQPLEPVRTLRTIISDNSNNAGPQFSPDGKRLVFMSNRSGLWQIWVSNADGSNPVQLTFDGGAGTPRWSPDGRSIAFDSPSDQGTSIFVIPADGSSPARRLVRGLVPSFSRDGKWIYYASDRHDDWQVWKVSLDGTLQQQVTSHGGFSAQESKDGYVYYSKSRYPDPGICRVPIGGGEEACVLPHLRPRTWSSWAVTKSGILFIEDLPEGKSALSLYEPDKRQVSDLVTLQTAPFWMGATADGKKAIINDAEERQISLVDNLR